MSSSQPGHRSKIHLIDESCREEFEQAWLAGARKPISNCLPDHDSERYRATLEELIRIQMNLQWKAVSRSREATTFAGKPKTVQIFPTLVEGYIGQFPEMGDVTTKNQLVRQEFLIRQHAGDHPNLGDYRSRFPEINFDNLLSAEELRQADTVYRSPDERNVNTDVWPGSIEGYRLLGRIGSGGMGAVYRAQQLAADRIVALKLIRADRLSHVSEAARTEMVERFRTEAQAAARLDHPNVVGIFEVGTDNPAQPWFSMQFVEGKSLAEHLSGGPVECRAAAEFIHQISDAISAAHKSGILHRDLKPQNIFLRAVDKQVLVGDFGLAKFNVDDAQRTSHEDILGTPAYMSPEQVRDSSSVNEATDIWSIGATLYHLLTGRPPFQAASPIETLRQVLNHEPTSPRALNPAVDRDLETICLKCLQKNPQHRYASASLLDEDVSLYLTGRPITARPVGRAEHVYRWCRRNPLEAALAGSAMTAVVVAVVSLWVGYRTAADALIESTASHRLARQTVHDLFTEVSETVLLEKPGMQPLRQRLHERALSYYRRFVASGRDSPELRKELGDVWFRIGRIEKELSRPEEADIAFRQALNIQLPLVNAEPTIPRRKALSSTWNATGSLYLAQHQWADAADALLRALELREQLVSESPLDAELKRLHSNTIMNLGAVHRNRGELMDALNAFKKAGGLQRQLLKAGSLEKKTERLVRRGLGMAWYNSANASFDMQAADIQDNVLVPLNEAVSLFSGLLEEQPNSYTDKRRLILCRQLQAEADPDVEKAAHSAAEAANEMRQLVSENPAVPSLTREWVQLQLLSGRLFTDSGMSQNALLQFEAVISMLNPRLGKLYEDSPRDRGIVTAEAALAAMQMSSPDVVQRLNHGRQLLRRTLIQSTDDEECLKLLELVESALVSVEE